MPTALNALALSSVKSERLVENKGSCILSSVGTIEMQCMMHKIFQKVTSLVKAQEMANYLLAAAKTFHACCYPEVQQRRGKLE